MFSVIGLNRIYRKVVSFRVRGYGHKLLIQSSMALLAASFSGAGAAQSNNNDLAFIVPVISLLLEDEKSYRSCAHALQEGNSESGIYPIKSQINNVVSRVYCDQTTDGGGWTLVGSAAEDPLKDQANNYHSNLRSLAPQELNANVGIWNGLRGLSDRWDVRFACRDDIGEAQDPFTVDLSFYDVNWYTEFTNGTDADSCFSEANGAGADSPTPARRDNVENRFRRKTNAYDSELGYLEGEDNCDSVDDFTVDFDDRGMDSEQSDGTDWGQDDRARKCGTTGLATGQWFVMVRERPRVATLGLPSRVANLLREEGGFYVEELEYSDPDLASKITTEHFDTLVIGRYSVDSNSMTVALQEALAVYGRNGGNIVTEWDGASVFMGLYSADHRYRDNLPDPLVWFVGEIGGGNALGEDTQIDIVELEDPIFENVDSPSFSGGGATQFFFTLSNLTPGLEVLATIPSAGSTPAIVRGRYCAGNFIAATFDWSDEPDEPGLGNLVVNMVREASKPPKADTVDFCPDSQRSNYALCGSSSRSLSDFGLPDNEVATCLPDDNDQVMFVTRFGAPNFNALPAADIRNYVINGGIIITEFSASDEVYNKVFNGDVTQAQSRLGGCNDAIMPAVGFSPENGFWQDNRLDPTPSINTGCGYDISGFSGITRLGGWTEDTTSLGYRDLGQGRVWFVESDWQDDDGNFDDADLGLMQYMVSHRANGVYGSGSLFGGVFEEVRTVFLLTDNYQPCLKTPYSSNSLSLDAIKDECNGETLIVACRATGSENLSVWAMGQRDEVFDDTGDAASATNQHNDVAWYFSENKSMGFAPGDETVNRNSCDVQNRTANDRLCWHTNLGALGSGWRCGNATGSSTGNAYERIIFHREGDAPEDRLSD